MSGITIESAKNAVSPYLTQAGDFIFRNWGDFKNASVHYGTKVYETPAVQYVVRTTAPYFNKAASYIPESCRFSWSTGTAVATVSATIVALFAIGKVVTVPGSSGK